MIAGVSALVLSVLIPTCLSTAIDNFSQYRNHIPDFRYQSARIEAITKLPNDTLIVVSNGFYWVLRDGQLPRTYNVRGKVSDLHPKFKRIDAMFTDPSYNEMDPKIFIMEFSYEDGLMIACQEFNGPFRTDNSFCNLPIDSRWFNALKDLNLQRPIDAAVWRNRSRDKEGGFWTFYQGSKFTVVDPFKMEARFTYDITEWMNITEPITATFYDFKKKLFYLFHDHNEFRIWNVNATLMRSLPMGWDRAFLHGSLSNKLAINKDFFKFAPSELFNYDQPHLIKNLFVLKEKEETTTQKPKEDDIRTDNEIKTNDLIENETKKNDALNQQNNDVLRNDINIQLSDEGWSKKSQPPESSASKTSLNLMLLIICAWNFA